VLRCMFGKDTLVRAFDIGMARGQESIRVFLCHFDNLKGERSVSVVW
jgi:hypothetical protein